MELISVSVRKRPLNKKELAKKEDDVVTVYDSAYLTVHEPKLKVDLIAYEEKHEFCFDVVLDEHVSNDEVRQLQTKIEFCSITSIHYCDANSVILSGIGKTYTMQPLPLRAAGDLVRQLHQPVYRNQRFKLWLSYFEIYGGKLFDLISDRKWDLPLPAHPARPNRDRVQIGSGLIGSRVASGLKTDQSIF
ncbi:unnamed protein product [Lupinus luteus]|uniref:Kinesin motor domain-containing protein n=1 Tax=Lupinus luteus TaxID=3873 RepID=A0AAV1WNP3_LUPLU